MASRFNDLFVALKAKKRKALGVYLTVGDPDVATTFECADAAVQAGADFLELGMPFSDPSADGPVIQHAMERALKAGTKLSDVLALAAQLRAKHSTLPILLFGYANPFFQAHRRGHLAPALQKAQVDALLVVDLPADHREPLAGLPVESITLLGPNATDDRVALAAKHAQGFVYLVALAGVTGSGQRSGDLDNIASNVARMKSKSDVPVCIGFGVRTADDAHKLAPLADGIVAGSVFVDQIDGKKAGAADRVGKKVAELRSGLDR